ncbi:MAG: hypothetical protein WCB79_04100 [Halobacteriota archaeon]
MKCSIIGGTRTGVGKTTITLALLKGLSSAGYDVQSFKVGPGFVDAKLHERLTGRPCYNLDVFLMGEAGVKRDLEKRTWTSSSLRVPPGCSPARRARRALPTSLVLL